jgi:hypothetical protein
MLQLPNGKMSVASLLDTQEYTPKWRDLFHVEQTVQMAVEGGMHNVVTLNLYNTDNADTDNKAVELTDITLAHITVVDGYVEFFHFCACNVEITIDAQAFTDCHDYYMDATIC